MTSEQVLSFAKGIEAQCSKCTLQSLHKMKNLAGQEKQNQNLNKNSTIEKNSAKLSMQNSRKYGYCRHYHLPRQYPAYGKIWGNCGKENMSEVFTKAKQYKIKQTTDTERQAHTLDSTNS